MDSVLDYVHWEKSSLTVFADAWISDERPFELIIVPQEFDFVDINLEAQLKDWKELKESKKPPKQEWKPNPMEM